MSIGLVFYVIALVCFILAAIPIPTGRVSLLPLGLAFMVLGMISGGILLR